MKQVTFEPICIFSVFQGCKSISENQRNHRYISSLLKEAGVNYKESLGVYKGESELSFIVSARFIKTVETICKQYKQESYLYSGVDRSSWLVYLSGKRESIGVLQPVSEAEAVDSGAYTNVNNQFFICK